MLKEHETEAKTAELARKHGISEATFHNWEAKFGWMDISEAERLKALKDENDKLESCRPSRCSMRLREQLSKNGGLLSNTPRWRNCRLGWACLKGGPVRLAEQGWPRHFPPTASRVRSTFDQCNISRGIELHAIIPSTLVAVIGARRIEVSDHSGIRPCDLPVIVRRLPFQSAVLMGVKQ